tara:strand:- start:2385 stop:2609 length:225 start_codon:yes stop_codon:yes gene_type:complete
MIKSQNQYAHRSGNINNTITNRNPQPPFRELDDVMRIGKYKGRKIQTLPKDYIKWLLSNFKLDYGKEMRLRKLL